MMTLARDSLPPVRKVQSLQNSVVKLVRSLEMRKARRETGLFMAEGTKVVVTAREQGWVPRILLVSEAPRASPIRTDLITWALGSGADCLELPASVFTKISGRDNPQHVIGVFPQRWCEVPETPGPDDVMVVLEDVRDPGNLGTIIRTADAAGARGVILVGTCCDPYALQAVRATMGSIFSVPLMHVDHGGFRRFSARWSGEVVGTHLSAREDFRRTYVRPVLLVMGSEGPGLSDDLAKACSHLVKIPMAGHADSLNLAIATSLMLYGIQSPFLRADQ